MTIRSYSELVSLPTYDERYEYAKILGQLGFETFGFDRYLNQMFYHRSKEWKQIREYVIARDMGLDLAMEGHEISDRILVHHLNPLTKEDFRNLNADALLNPEYLVCVSHLTHNAIHYGTKPPEQFTLVERRPNDTIPWKG